MFSLNWALHLPSSIFINQSIRLTEMMVSVMYKFNTVVSQNILEYCGFTEHSLNTVVCTAHSICHTHPLFPPSSKKNEGKISIILSMREPNMMSMMKKGKISTIHGEPWNEFIDEERQNQHNNVNEGTWNPIWCQWWRKGK